MLRGKKKNVACISLPSELFFIQNVFYFVVQIKENIIFNKLILKFLKKYNQKQEEAFLTHLRETLIDMCKRLLHSSFARILMIEIKLLQLL